MKKIIVLGGTGFVGAHVCEKLVSDGWDVTVPTRRRANANDIMHLPNLTVLELDVHDEAALTRAVAGRDALVNLVAILHGTQESFDRTHVELPRKIARACLAGGVQQMVHISALGADAVQPDKLPSMYLRSKSEGEAVLTQAASAGAAAGREGFDLSILRPSVIFGAKDKFINVFAKLQRIFPVMPLAGATARFQPVWVQDVAQAVVNCLAGASKAASPRIIEAVGPEVFTLKELVQLSAKLAGIGGGFGRPVFALPEWAGRLQAKVMSLAPGEPVMSDDNLDSMKLDNVSTGQQPGLASLGITASSLQPIAQEYLNGRNIRSGLMGVRSRSH
ncbi:complex I NDUFA9 subunit family protein [Rhodoferax antarcticus]|uniref:complex I NDUFA9 subunit family protein n=1 Tax=Rhodoferax antarcticus TaxID=81479 RepID=UPI00222510D2|nr:complex I NDUFA9 subunit family protein [Rhodoferax antarcticus]MCW2311609.1 NADH dehydrogenase [Rhodoferax antarcticus]